MLKSIVAALLLCSSWGTGYSENESQELALVVGTYTDTGSHGIYSLRFNQETGAYVLLDSLALVNPSYLTFGKDSRVFYAVSELGDKNASLNSVGFNAKTGQMRLLNTVATDGEDPCYVEVANRMALTANYSGGSLSTFVINRDGTLSKLKTRFEGHVGGPDSSRQGQAHIHCVKKMNDGYILASDFSADQLLAFRLDTADNVLKPRGVAGRLPLDSGPRHIITSRNGRLVYVMSELSGAVTVFRYHAGRVKLVQSVLSDSAFARGGADIHLTPDGRFLYASNRLKNDGLSIFQVLSNGKLRKVGYQRTGIHPRNFNITPNGRYLLAACRDSDMIQIFRIDKRSGMLEDTGRLINLPHPVCIQFAKR